MNELTTTRPLHQVKPDPPIRTVGFLSSLIFLIVFVSIIVGQVGHNYLLDDPDTYWHVVVGRDIWESEEQKVPGWKLLPLMILWANVHAGEADAVSRGLHMPFGTTLVCLARKN
jgi:hypothetical protein